MANLHRISVFPNLEKQYSKAEEEHDAELEPAEPGEPPLDLGLGELEHIGGGAGGSSGGSGGSGGAGGGGGTTAGERGNSH